MSGVVPPHSRMPSGHVQAQLYFTLNMPTDTTSHSHYVASTTKFQASTSVDTIKILHWYRHKIQYLLSFSKRQSLLGNFCSSTTPSPYKCFSYLQKNKNLFQNTQTRKLITKYCIFMTTDGLISTSVQDLHHRHSDCVQIVGFPEVINGNNKTRSPVW
jgi:hypothetical protein